MIRNCASVDICILVELFGLEMSAIFKSRNVNMDIAEYQKTINIVWNFYITCIYFTDNVLVY